MNRVVISFLMLVGLPAYAQDSSGPGELDPRFQPDKRLEADTALGQLSIGLSGLRDHARQQSTTGDVEFGTLYQVELDSEFPRLAELRPFVFNRIESNETAYYESLGVGVGVRASVREKYEQNNWFVRLSVLTPSEQYTERYSQNGRRGSVVEVFAGFEVPLDPAGIDRDMRERVTPPTVIRLGVSPQLFASDEPIEARLLERVHVLMVGAYLSRVNRMVYEDGDRPTPIASDWPVLGMIERVTGEPLSEHDWLTLRTDMIDDPAERTARRRAIVAEALGRGLTAMMRGPYPLVFEPVDLRAGASAQGDATDARRATSVARVSRPGVGMSASQDPLDADAMIQHYIQYVVGRIE